MQTIWTEERWWKSDLIVTLYVRRWLNSTHISVNEVFFLYLLAFLMIFTPKRFQQQQQQQQQKKTWCYLQSVWFVVWIIIDRSMRKLKGNRRQFYYGFNFLGVCKRPYKKISDYFHHNKTQLEIELTQIEQHVSVWVWNEIHTHIMFAFEMEIASGLRNLCDATISQLREWIYIWMEMGQSLLFSASTSTFYTIGRRFHFKRSSNS